MVIFDWDGTLCDSVEGIVDAMQSAALAQGLVPPVAQAVRDIVGLGLPEAMAALFPDLDGAGRGAMTEAYSDHYRARTASEAVLFEGALETLSALRERGLALGVATGKSRRGLERVLGLLDMADFFDSTRCADETASKPDPTMLLEIMAEQGKTPDEVIVVGDSEYDLAMAAAAGVRSVGVSFGVHDSARLSRHNPLAVVDSLPELLDLPALSRATG